MSATEPVTESAPSHFKAKLGVLDTVAIIVGIVIGTVIFKAPTFIFKNTSSPWEGLGVWLIGGILALVGAFIYAELATTYPRSGGDYVYLTRAFGRPVGFLFGWAQLVVVLSGSTGAMAFVFGDFAANLMEYGRTDPDRAYFVTMAAIGAVVVFTVLNFLGVVLGKRVQDTLVIVKLAGMALIVFAGLFYPASDAFTIPEGADMSRMIGLGTALIVVLYAYGGWNDAAFVASELKDPRSITKSLIGGILLITVIYLLVNLAYILGLGWMRARDFGTGPLPVAVLSSLSAEASKIMAVIVMISALGAINGLIFTGSRVYASMGQDHSLFSFLGKWNKKLGAPIYAVSAQAVVTLFMILQVGTETGRTATNNVLSAVGIEPIPWARFDNDGFEALFAGTAATFWIFFLLTGLSIFVLRVRDPQIERPFRLHFPWFPLLPFVFCGMCIFGIYSAITFAGWLSLIGFVPLAIGVPIYILSASRDQAARAPQEY